MARAATILEILMTMNSLEELEGQVLLDLCPPRILYHAYAWKSVEKSSQATLSKEDRLQSKA